MSFSGELEISMIMKGLIYEPFGISKLAFGDMIIALGITIAGGLPSFRKSITLILTSLALIPDEERKST